MNERREHYSNKGGHKERGDANKTYKLSEKAFGEVIRPNPYSILETDWQKRRYMRRIPRDGRK